MLAGEPKHRLPLCYGGSHSEQQWRNEFNAGRPADRPVPDRGRRGRHPARLRVIKKPGGLVVFNTLDRFRSEVTSYSRELDESYEPTEKIKDKETFHLLDSARYLLSAIRPASTRRTTSPGR
jgi:hypothetical protein